MLFFGFEREQRGQDIDRVMPERRMSDYFQYISVQEDAMLYWVGQASKHLHDGRRRVVEVIQKRGGGWIVVLAQDLLPTSPPQDAVTGAKPK